jgi:hypothetical protein
MKLSPEELEMLDERTRETYLALEREAEQYKKDAIEYQGLKQKFSQAYLDPSKRALLKTIVHGIDPKLAQELPDRIEAVDNILEPVNRKLAEIDKIKEEMRNSTAKNKILETAAKYGIPDDPATVEDIKKFMQKYNISDPVAGVELYGQTEWLTAQQLKSARGTIKDKLYPEQGTLDMSDEEIMNKIYKEIGV